MAASRANPAAAPFAAGGRRGSFRCCRRRRRTGRPHRTPARRFRRRSALRSPRAPLPCGDPPASVPNSSPSHVPCQRSPSAQVTPVTKRFDSIVRRIAPVSGSTSWILRSRYCPTQSAPSAQARPKSPPPPGAGMAESTRPVTGSIFSMRSSAIWKRCSPSKAVPACPAAAIACRDCASSGSKALILSPLANQTRLPS